MSGTATARILEAKENFSSAPETRSSEMLQDVENRDVVLESCERDGSRLEKGMR